MTRRSYVVGNWKMHGVGKDLHEIEAIASRSAGFHDVDVALCVPATLLQRAAATVADFPIGAQDVHKAAKGAHTGCVSAEMLSDCGASLTLVGHSERREAQHESDAEVRAKAQAALAAGLDVILCVGETLEVREAGLAVSRVERQLLDSAPEKLAEAARFAVAYEPVWAIGTGRIPSTHDISEMHSALRARLADRFGDSARAIRVLYGGSVKASNASEIFALKDVDGALVGGASLKCADFLPIVEAASQARPAG